MKRLTDSTTSTTGRQTNGQTSTMSGRRVLRADRRMKKRVIRVNKRVLQVGVLRVTREAMP